ncbi:MAG: LLM class flavin-dependent oxidoreductase [Pseudomonadota bacterium]|nr:LLM class flavin-dependent oxidoreductase [Pseudomonadota bacterium]
MEIGFFFWPYDPALVNRMAVAGDRYGYDMIGIADTPGNAMDPWVVATMVALNTENSRIGLVVTNLVSREPAVSAAAIASLDLVAPERTVLGIGAGHSGTANLGMERSGLNEMASGIRHIKTLLDGEPDSLNGGPAHIPWIKRSPKVFLAASGPRTLSLGGAVADGLFINYGITADNIAQSEKRVQEGLTEAGRTTDDVEIWQIASLECNENATEARTKAGAILAFMAGGYILSTPDLLQQGVPEEFHAPIMELRKRYSTRPGAADAALVHELGLFDYLAGRFAICGTPDQCLEQILDAHMAGLRRVMFTVSVASDPAKTVELFGEKVLPRLRDEIS